MELEKAKKIAHDVRYVYHNDSIDIEGGEPTIWPHINEFVAYCSSIGLLPTLITNGIVLADRERLKKLKSAGLRDLLVSVHGLGEVYDTMVGRAGSAAKQQTALANCLEEGIPVRFNCVLTKESIPQLAEISRHAIRYNALVVNFITFNPFEDQASLGRTAESVPYHTEAAPQLTRALDILDEAGIEANVRYFPLCLLEERHRKSAYNLKQLPWDPHEWDFDSWHWTNRKPQMMRGAPLMPHHKSLEEVIPGLDAGERTKEQNPAVYQAYAEKVIGAWCAYRHPATCEGCGLKAVCDGLTGDYVRLHGTAEPRPVSMKEPPQDPRFYISRQRKLTGPEWNQSPR